MKIIIKENQLSVITKFLINEEMGSDITMEEVWKHNIHSHFEWMIEKHFKNNYNENDMLLYFRFMCDYVINNIDDDIKNGYYNNDEQPRKLGFNIQDIKKSYELFSRLVKEFMEEIEIEKPKEKLKKIMNLIIGNKSLKRDISKEIIEKYYEKEKKKMNIFDYLDVKDRSKSIGIDTDMDKGMSYGFFAKDLLEKIIEEYIHDNDIPETLDGLFYDVMFEYMQDKYGEFILNDVHKIFFK